VSDGKEAWIVGIEMSEGGTHWSNGYLLWPCCLLSCHAPSTNTFIHSFWKLCIPIIAPSQIFLFFNYSKNI